MSSSSSSESVSARPPVGATNTDIHAQKASIETERPSSDLGSKTTDSEKGLKKLEGKGCTGGAVASALRRGGHGALRVLAGAIGIPLYAAATIIGGGASLVVFLGAGALGVSAGALGAGVGAVIGGIASLGNKEGFEKGAQIGGTIGAMGFGVVPAVLAEVALFIPKGLILLTVGQLGAGLTAFALTGKTENEQLERRKEKKDAGKVSTNLDLYNKLISETYINLISLKKLGK